MVHFRSLSLFIFWSFPRENTICPTNYSEKIHLVSYGIQALIFSPKYIPIFCMIKQNDFRLKWNGSEVTEIEELKMSQESTNNKKGKKVSSSDSDEPDKEIDALKKVGHDKNDVTNLSLKWRYYFLIINSSLFFCLFY